MQSKPFRLVSVIKGQDVDNIYLGDTLTDDGFRTRHFDFLLSNPPFGVAWNTQQKSVTDEYEQRGFAGRFGPGLPRVSDGSLLFLLHLISKMQPVKSWEGGSRLAIVLNGSPLFTGGAPLLEPIHVLGVLSASRLAVVRVCFHQMWPWWWRKVVVVADDLAMACQAPEGRSRS